MQIRSRVSEQSGFTLVEVLVAAVVLVVGLGSLLQMLVTADHVISTTRLRQEETSVAREVLEDARGLASTQLTSTAIASALQPVIPQATVSSSNLVVTRSVSSGTPTSFNVSFNVCDLDDPSDGYGNHGLSPASGGVWCPDVASNGTQDSNPDDYQRLLADLQRHDHGGRHPHPLARQRQHAAERADPVGLDGSVCAVRYVVVVHVELPER
jgi:prepilin-type N-terminal cleavage/methylation domain-containing protein